MCCISTPRFKKKVPLELVATVKQQCRGGYKKTSMLVTLETDLELVKQWSGQTCTKYAVCKGG